MRPIRHTLIKFRKALQLAVPDVDSNQVNEITLGYGILYLFIATWLSPLFFTESLLGRLIVYLPSTLFFGFLATLHFPRRNQLTLILDRSHQTITWGTNSLLGNQHSLETLSQAKVENRKEMKTVSSSAFGATTTRKAWVTEYRLILCFTNRSDVSWIPWTTPSAYPLSRRRLERFSKKINHFISQTEPKKLTLMGDPLRGLFGIFSAIAFIFAILSMSTLVTLFYS